MAHPSMLSRRHLTGGDALKFQSFLFVRHGRTEHNLRRIVQGHRDIPLDEVGRYEAEQAAAAVAALGWVEYVASSDLARARATAEALAFGHGLPVALDADLRERSFGPYEGGPAGPDFWGSRVEGVEDCDDFAERIARALMRHAPGRNTAIVAHGGVLRVIGWMFDLALPDAAFRNAAPLRFTFRDGAWRVVDVLAETMIAGRNAA
ncbi:MAG: histidine phosphatase family protein [Salinarimonadaceae bacterium]|nr:MAG: histidine phosphatase family protein [Salinarimonadaceae bacterium]